MRRLAPLALRALLPAGALVLAAAPAAAQRPFPTARPGEDRTVAPGAGRASPGGVPVQAAPPGAAATQQRMHALQRQIQLDQDRLRRALEAETITASTLDALDREVASREALVVTYGMRVEQVRAERDSLARTLGLLTGNVVALRGQQAALARHAYKRGRLSDLALLFSSGSVTEMVRRARFLGRIWSLRTSHAARLERSMSLLQARQAALTRAEREASRTLSDASLEQQTLAETQRRRAVAVEAMRGQRSGLEGEIARRQQDLAGLEGQMRAAASATATRLRDAPPAETAAAAEAGRAFDALRGRLPWPVPGVVTQAFGWRTDPVTGARTRHPGVQIATEPAALVACVFSGTVARVGQMPTFGTYLVVDHGTYQTLYANLSALAVRRGDRVEAGQVLGKAGVDGQPLGASLFFALSRQEVMSDPAPWLVPR